MKSTPRNIAKTRSGTYQVRITRNYLRSRINVNKATLPEAIAARDELERKYPLTPSGSSK